MPPAELPAVEVGSLVSPHPSWPRQCCVLECHNARLARALQCFDRDLCNHEQVEPLQPGDADRDLLELQSGLYKALERPRGDMAQNYKAWLSVVLQVSDALGGDGTAVGGANPVQNLD